MQSRVAKFPKSLENEDTFETDIDLLLIANNLYVNENNILHYDDLIQVRANEVESMANLKSVYIKEMQDDYYVMEPEVQE